MLQKKQTVTAGLQGCEEALFLLTLDDGKRAGKRLEEPLQAEGAALAKGEGP